MTSINKRGVLEEGNPIVVYQIGSGGVIPSSIEKTLLVFRQSQDADIAYAILKY